MAEIIMDENEEQDPEAQESAEQPKSNFLKLGIPIILAQIVIAYFLASYYIVPTFFDVAQAETMEEEDEGDDEEFGFIVNVEDVIVNPAESGGSRYVVLNIAFELKEEADVELFKTREPKVRDILIRIISGRTVEQLDGADDKETLRKEIMEKIKKIVAKGHLKNMYFVNYIIQ